MQLTGIQSSDMGLVQAIADNFDANITSPNGLKSTHVLAPLMTQVCPNTEDGQEALQSKDSGRKIIRIYSIWYTDLLLSWSKKSEIPEEVLVSFLSKC